MENVLAYGAVGDGVTDDTAAIDIALATGKNILFPEGHTFITSGLHQVTTDHQHLRIDGVVRYDGVRRLIDTPSWYGFMGLFQVQDQVEGVKFDGNGTLDGNWNRAGPTTEQPLHFRDTGSGIYAYRARSLRVSGLTFTRFSENGLKLFNCPDVQVDRSTRFIDICNVGTEIHSYKVDPRSGTGADWAGEVFAPSGSVSGFYDLIDDGEFFANYGNGCGVLFHCAANALAISHLSISGHFRDCLAAIWSENNTGETRARNISISDVHVEGNYRGAANASSLAGIGLIGVENSRVSNVVMTNVGNVAPASGSQSAGFNIIECDGITVSDFSVTDAGTSANPTQYGFRIAGGSNITIMDGNIDGVAIAPIYRPAGGSAPTNVRIENVRGAVDEETWGNLTKVTFALQNIPDSSATKLLVVGEPGAEAAVMPASGRLVSMSVRGADGQVFTGDYSFQCRINGVSEPSLNCVSSGATGSQGTFATADGASQAVSAQSAGDAPQVDCGGLVSVIAVTDGYWNAGCDAYADVWIDVGMKA